MALALITDRAAADVARLRTLAARINADGWATLTAAEQAEWDAGKGAYNTTDLNRVGDALNYLTALIRSYGYPVNTTASKTNWFAGDESTDPDEFNAADGAAYLANVAAIKAAFYGTTTIPASMNNMSPEDMNNIERQLLEIEDHLVQMAAAFRYCGELICGEDQ